MRKFKMEIDLDCSAFKQNEPLELARCLHAAAYSMEGGERGGQVIDANGEICGRFRIVNTTTVARKA